MYNHKKKTLLLLLILYLILICSPVYGQAMKGKFALSGTSGLGLPLGDFSDKLKGRAQTGYGWGGNLEYFITDNISLGANFRYHKFGMYVRDLEEDFIKFVHDSIPEADTSGIDINSDRSVMHLGVFGKYHFFTGKSFSPFIKMGLGWGKLKGSADMPGYVVYPGYTMTIDRIVDASYDADFYFDAGGGVVYLFSERVGISGELLFTHLATYQNSGRVTTKTQANGDFQEEEEEIILDYNSSYIDLFLSLTFFF